VAIVDELSADLEYPSSTPTMASSPRPAPRRGPPRPRGWLVRGSRRPWRLSVADKWYGAGLERIRRAARTRSSST
jgi:hypothetical protein